MTSKSAIKHALRHPEDARLPPYAHTARAKWFAWFDLMKVEEHFGSNLEAKSWIRDRAEDLRHR